MTIYSLVMLVICLFFANIEVGLRMFSSNAHYFIIAAEVTVMTNNLENYFILKYLSKVRIRYPQIIHVLCILTYGVVSFPNFINFV
jgi:hypothetical protein